MGRDLSLKIGKYLIFEVTLAKGQPLPRRFLFWYGSVMATVGLVGCAVMLWMFILLYNPFSTFNRTWGYNENYHPLQDIAIPTIGLSFIIARFGCSLLLLGSKDSGGRGQRLRRLAVWISIAQENLARWFVGATTLYAISCAAQFILAWVWHGDLWLAASRCVQLSGYFVAVAVLWTLTWLAQEGPARETRNVSAGTGAALAARGH